MKFILALCLATFHAITAVAEIPESPIGKPDAFVSARCKITKVLVTPDQLDIFVSGRLGSSVKNIDKLFQGANGILFSIIKDKKADRTKFAGLSNSVKKLEGMFASLDISTEAYMLRGGIIILSFSNSEFKIAKSAEQGTAANP